MLNYRFPAIGLAVIQNGAKPPRTGGHRAIVRPGFKNLPDFLGKASRLDELHRCSRITRQQTLLRSVAYPIIESSVDLARLVLVTAVLRIIQKAL